MRNVERELLLELFDYRDGHLYNKVTRGPNAVKGSQAGSFNPSNGYMRVAVKGKIYGLHRIVWMMHNGDIPGGMHIDHIDRDPLNNRIENLRCASPQVNEWNKDFNNVSFENGKWRARLQKDGKYYHLGCYTDQSLAIQAAQQGKEQLRQSV